MSKRETIRTSKKECIEYWSKRVSESEIGTDWDLADRQCWRCGKEADLQRCHIVPDSLGGKDEAPNIVLLCERCHEEGPNVEDPEIMWDWIKAYAKPNEFQFLFSQINREYEYIYNRSIEDEIIFFSNYFDEEEISNLIATRILDNSKRATNHFGQPFLSVMNGVGILRMLFKEIAKGLNIEYE